MTKKTNNEDLSKAYTIDLDGSLGLLAFGDLGLRAWRKVKQNIEEENKTNEKK